MKRWYQWFFLSFCFAAGGVLNYLDGRKIIASIIPVGLTVIMAFIQLICDKKGGKEKAAYKYISIGIMLLLFLWILHLIFGTET